jgi:two-component system LytT family response regulator
MKILAADDEPYALKSIERAIKNAEPEAVIFEAVSGNDVLQKTAENGPFDVAFLDIKMPGITGLALAKQLRENCPKMNIIFVTAYSEYALDAYSVLPSGYLMKPVTEDMVRMELDNLRYPLVPKEKPKLWIQCFGNFEIFYDQKPLNFKYHKTKEIIAYLVDRRGATCDTAELCAVLWEDEPNTQKQHVYLRKLLSDLTHTLRKVGAEKVFVKNRNSFAIDPRQLKCDYYQMLNGDMTVINQYTGEYMSQYSWAEMTIGNIENQ